MQIPRQQLSAKAADKQKAVEPGSPPVTEASTNGATPPAEQANVHPVQPALPRPTYYGGTAAANVYSPAFTSPEYPLSPPIVPIHPSFSQVHSHLAPPRTLPVSPYNPYNTSTFYSPPTYQQMFSAPPTQHPTGRPVSVYEQPIPPRAESSGDENPFTTAAPTVSGATGASSRGNAAQAPQLPSGTARMRKQSTAKPLPKAKPSAINAEAGSSRKRGRSLSPPPPPARRNPGGRQPGAAGYSNADLTKMCELTEDMLPIAPDEWTLLVAKFNRWAVIHGRPERGDKAFKSKWDAMVRQPKPTGRADVPPFIEKSWGIDAKISERAHTRAIHDEQIDGPTGEENGRISATGSRRRGLRAHDDIIVISDSSDDNIAPPSKKTKPASTQGTRNVAPTGPVAQKRTRGAVTNSLLDNIAATFDPEAQAAREDARMARNTQTSAFNAILMEMRDNRARMDTLVERLSTETRRADRLEAELRMYERIGVMGTSPFPLNTAGAARGERSMFESNTPWPQSGDRRPTPSTFEASPPYSHSPTRHHGYPPATPIPVQSFPSSSMPTTPSRHPAIPQPVRVTETPRPQTFMATSSDAAAATPSAFTRAPMVNETAVPPTQTVPLTPGGRNTSESTNTGPTGLNALASAASEISYTLTITPRRQRIAQLTFDVGEGHSAAEARNEN